MTTPARSPIVDGILNATIPPVAGWLVRRMRRMEEVETSAETRWEILRIYLEQLARDAPSVGG